MPKILKIVAAKKLDWQTYELPPLKPDQIRIKSEFATAKHGTELSVYKGVFVERGAYVGDYQVFDPSKPPGWGTFPAGVGNMVVGTVTEAGAEVKDFKPGDRALSYGGFMEVHTSKAADCWKMPKDLLWKSAVCLDPADFALAAVRDGHVRVGDAVAVFGLGAISLVAIQVAKLAGAHPIIAVDMLPRRLEAATACGVDYVLDPTKCDAGWEIKKLTNKRGVDVAIEYSGSAKALQAAIRSAAYGGRVVCGACPAPYPAGLDLGAEAHHNVPDLIFTRACSEPNREHPRWNNKRVYEVCWRLICEGKISGEAIVQPVVPFGDLVTEYPKIDTSPGDSIKLGVKY